jgi:demethylmenaquinone methyltransferase/2-methoxy-6-polyprenyl-1,4-benzoquinol methylase
MSFQMPQAPEKGRYVQAMFDAIAGNYDRVNDLMTAGVHRQWKRQVVALTHLNPGGKALDLATGTGDIAFLLADTVGPQGEVVGLDFSEGMLSIARERDLEGRPITWVQGDMTGLALPDAAFDAVTVGYGLRNVTDLDKALSEIHRVLKPGGRAVSLDLGKPRFKLVRWGADLYSFKVVPLIGGIVSGNRDAYKYLPESNLSFVDQRELARRLKAVGFTDVEIHDRAMGAMAIVSATKPLA